MWTRNLYLLGYMGSGKSHLGQRLAQHFERPFIDLDARIELEQGETIATIFERYGEAHFRALEATALRATATAPTSVVALGGGAPIYHNNMTWLLAQGTTVFLDPPLEILLDRLLGATSDRPLLAGMSRAALRKRVTAMLAQRRPIYERAHYHIHEGRAQEQAILAALKGLE